MLHDASRSWIVAARDHHDHLPIREAASSDLKEEPPARCGSANFRTLACRDERLLVGCLGVSCGLIRALGQHPDYRKQLRIDARTLSGFRERNVFVELFDLDLDFFALELLDVNEVHIDRSGRDAVRNHGDLRGTQLGSGRNRELRRLGSRFRC